MATVTAPAASINAAGNLNAVAVNASTLVAPANAAPTNLAAVAWQALGYVAGKEARRDDLNAGAAHSVNLTVSGLIDGQSFEEHFSGDLTVGHDSTRSSSVVPNVAQVVAAILAKLNPATREALCRDLPTEFAANGCSLPKLTVQQVEDAECLLAGLRAAKVGTVRGSVKCEYALCGETKLTVVG